MGIAGVLIKELLFPTNDRGKRMKKIIHIGVMPCHDKKLEASRKDFFFPATKIRSTSTTIHDNQNNAIRDEEDLLEPTVDLVITTQEWWTLISDTYQLDQTLKESNDRTNS